MAVTTYSAAGSGFFLCPAGVTVVAVACWGGGGGGGGSSAAPSSISGAGGGGGEYAAEALVAVTPGRLYPFRVGNGGFSQGASFGGTSSFAGDSLAVTAHGARGGNDTSAGGTGSANTIHFDGGSGAGGNVPLGGGGGGSAGSGGAGGNGHSGVSGGAGGAAGAGGGAAGGRGSPLGGAGQAGFAPGAGGGGGTGGANGGFGAAGQVQLTYTLTTQPVVPYFPAGYKPLNSDFDQWIQAPDSFLTTKVAFRAELTVPLSLANGDTLIPFDSILEDPFSGWESGSSQWLCPAGYAATYDVALTVSCAAQGPQPVVQARVGVNSAAQEFTVDKAWVPASTVPGIASGSCQVQLYGGTDSVQGYVHLSNTGNAVTTAGQRCQMTIMWADL